MAENWTFYLCQMDGYRVSNYLDLGLAQAAPLPGLEQLIRIPLAMRSPRDDGLSSNEEYDTLIALEEDLLSEIRGTDPAIVYAGRSTAANHRTFFFYGNGQASLDEAVAKVLARHAGYECKVITGLDPQWSCYLEFLYPDEASLDQIREREEAGANQQVRDSLAEQGDDGTMPREITHWAYFAADAARDKYQLSVIEAGFTVEEAGAIDKGQFFLRFSHEESPAALDPVTEMLRKMALASGGDYDGWECPVIASTSEQ